MHWWHIGITLLLASVLLSGCNDSKQIPGTAPTASMIVYHYDPVRSVVIASTVPAVFTPEITPLDFATILATLPGVSYSPAPELQLADPQARVDNNTLTVDYQKATGLSRLTSTQAMAVQAMLEAWLRVPGVAHVNILAAGQPLTSVGSLKIAEPLQPTYHAYVVQPQTGEVAYLIDGPQPATPGDALAAMQKRVITETPATQGFQPLLPPDTTIKAATDKIENALLPVDLSANFPHDDSARLSGIILMLTQYPEVNTVRFTFDGKTIDQDIMRGNLKDPFSARLLMLPETVARVAHPQELETLHAAVQAKLGHAPASFGAGLIWRDWATLAVVPDANTAPQTFLLRQQAEGYTVVAGGTDMTADRLLVLNVPREVIIAFRLSGWQHIVSGTGNPE